MYVSLLFIQEEWMERRIHVHAIIRDMIAAVATTVAMDIDNAPAPLALIVSVLTARPTSAQLPMKSMEFIVSIIVCNI